MAEEQIEDLADNTTKSMTPFERENLKKQYEEI